VNAINAGREDTADTSHSGANVPTTAIGVCTFGILWMEVATKVAIWPASVFCVLTKHLGKWEVFAQWIPHVEQWSMCHACIAIHHPFPLLTIGDGSIL
jgi:hypothetical protein